MSRAIVKGDLEIAITRVFDAPRELVFAAWQKPENLAQWWGPRGFSVTTESMEMRSGGHWKYVMHGPDGTDYPNHVRFDQVIVPELITYSNSGGRQGDHVSFRATATFVDQAGKTELTMSMIFPTKADRDRVIAEYGAVEGLNDTTDRLNEFLHS